MPFRQIETEEWLIKFSFSNNEYGFTKQGEFQSDP